jgi:uncharacterized protein YlxP (DUF503 family)
MLVATCVIKLRLEGVYSLKDKRHIIKPILVRLPKQFNVAVAEVDKQDVWGTAVIALVTIGTDQGYVHGLLEKAVTWIEQFRPDVPIDEYRIEFY